MALSVGVCGVGASVLVGCGGPKDAAQTEKDSGADEPKKDAGDEPEPDAGKDAGDGTPDGGMDADVPEPPDERAPKASFKAKPGAQKNSRASAFELACDEKDCRFECSLDDAAFSECEASTSLEYLAPGSHTLEARAVDAAGNVGKPIAHTWSLTFGWRALTVADHTVCAVSGEGGLYCWGADWNGLLGDGGPFLSTPDAYSRPTRIGTATWSNVIGGPETMCAHDPKGKRFCWGDNYYGQFGDPAYTEERTGSPVSVSNALPTLSFNQEHACALDAAGHLLCWGSDDEGKLGDGTPDDEQHTPTMIGSATWSSVSAGVSHTCAVRSDGALYCFGDNDSGESGQSPVSDFVATPTRVGSDDDWASVSAGSGFTCALKKNHELWCFGGNWYGALGDGTHTQSSTPVRVGSDQDWSNVNASEDSVCAVKLDGRAFCWGDNRGAQLGSNLMALDSADPGQVNLEVPVAYVKGTRELVCAMLRDDRIVCWGDNSGGALGRGIAGSEPTPVGFDTGYVALSVSSAAYGDTLGGGCGIKDDGKLYCWGTGQHVGMQGWPLVLEPTAVSQDTGWTAIDLLGQVSPISQPATDPYGHACGIRSGALYCWGENKFGQLGTGDTTVHAEPTQVTAIADTWTSVSVGTFSTCGLTTSKKVYCWGKNAGGELGQGDTVQRSTPTQVGSVATYDKLELNGGSVIAHREDGTLWTWGYLAGSTPVQADTGNGVVAASDWVDAKIGSNFWCGLKTDHTVHCRTLSYALVAVTSLSDAGQLFDFESQYCGIRTTGELFCLRQESVTSWVISADPYYVPPAGNDWLSYEWGYVSCGLKSGGQRFCSGQRHAGMLGDGFDQRLPTLVLEP